MVPQRTGNPTGKDNSTPAEDVHNKNPSLVALGKNMIWPPFGHLGSYTDDFRGSHTVFSLRTLEGPSRGTGIKQLSTFEGKWFGLRVGYFFAENAGNAVPYPGFDRILASKTESGRHSVSGDLRMIFPESDERRVLVV